MNNFLRIYKLKINTLNQGLAMTSYERSVPKALSTGTLKVVRNDDSYFDRLKLWDDYDHPETGFRDVLKSALDDFSASHREQMEEHLVPGSSAYTLASLSATASVSICGSIFQFLDDYVRQLTKSKFSFKKAFHVVTRLVRRIFIEIFSPRLGILKSFKAGDMSQISASILYSTLRSLNIAMTFKNTGFENLDVVSSELVKFLLVNTGYESISKLEIQVAALEASK